MEENDYIQDKGIIRMNGGETDLTKPHYLILKVDERYDMATIQEVTRRRVTMRLRLFSELKLYMKKIF